jgi:electron transfer flavoprotein beta subunit
MANVIVCYKWVFDEADLRFITEQPYMDTSRAKNKISDYDRNAIEEAVKAGSINGDEVVALTFGSRDIKKSVKDVLSRGPSKACLVIDDLANEADGYVTAEILAAAIRKIGDYRLVVCAEGASDTYARQVGPRIGALLDIPVITSVFELNLENNMIRAKRRLEEGIEIVNTKMPALICVLPEINKAPIPSLKAVLDASKKPTQEYKISDLGLDQNELTPRTRVKSRQEYTMNRKNIVITEGSNSEKVNQLLENLKKEGVI